MKETSSAPAEKASPDIVNFMIRHGRGQVCMPILPDLAKRLDLPMMVETNSTPLGTAFTVPVDHRTARTGITAAERADTIAAMMDPASTPSDFVRPGHLFPLVAKEEACCVGPATPRRRSTLPGWQTCAGRCPL